MAEYSFDIVCKVSLQELSNVLDATRKEVDNRFDFKGVKIDIRLEKENILLEASDEMRMKQMIDLIKSKMVRRDLNLKAFIFEEFEKNVSGAVKCKVNVQNGLNQEQIKKVTRLVKDSKLKVQARIQGDTVRIFSKSKNDLQQVQQNVREANFDFAVSFENYR